ncbi:hypothetical protein K438DRAFT_1789647 [Mycena galopus ATCC 62051]|nr:hypothetical protein K438DRAFT_1789647 [Mycena galopus ATCC 62051]
MANVRGWKIEFYRGEEGVAGEDARKGREENEKAEANAPKIIPPHPIPREHVSAQTRMIVPQPAHEGHARGGDDLAFFGGGEGDAELDALRTCQRSCLEEKEGRESREKEGRRRGKGECEGGGKRQKRRIPQVATARANWAGCPPRPALP